MQSLSHYHIIPFNEKTKNGFKTKNGTIAFLKKDANNIYESMKQQANQMARRSQAKILENALNAAIINNKIEYEKILTVYMKNIENINFQQLLKIDGLITVENGSLTVNKDVFNQNYIKIRNMTKSMFKTKTNKRNATAILKQIEGSVNAMRGQAFEYMMSAIMQKSEQILKDLSEESIDKLIDQFTVNLQQGSVKLTGHEKFKSQSGKQRKDYIEIKIDGNEQDFDTMTVRGGSVKSDLTLQLPNENLFTASLKDQTTGLDESIKLLSKGRVVSLIEQWPGTTPHLRNLAMNGLSARDLNSEQFNTMKKLFIIQAAMGSGALDINADYFIINTGIETAPIRVLSTYDLFFSNFDFIHDFGGMTGNKAGIPHLPQVPRTTSGFYNYVDSVVLSMKTQMSLI